jgi:hypothetical protein
MLGFFLLEYLLAIYTKGCTDQRVYANQTSTNQIQDTTYIAVFNSLVLATRVKNPSVPGVILFL